MLVGRSNVMGSSLISSCLLASLSDNFMFFDSGDVDGVGMMDNPQLIMIFLSFRFIRDRGRFDYVVGIPHSERVDLFGLPAGW